MLSAIVPLLISTNMAQLPTFKPAPREFRAAWVATVDNIDWPSKKTLTTAQQKAELIRIFDVAQKINLNAIVFQIRPSTDSLYESKLEPWSEFLTGQQGRKPDPYWDPLDFAVKEAHKRGIQLHTWFNPYRAKHFKATGPLADHHVFKTRPDITKQYGRYLWMDPGEPDTQKQTLDVMMDVVRRYDIDGIHIDDYFYPYAEVDENKNPIPFPDEVSYQRYRANGGTLNRGDWRRKNVDDMVERIYTNLKREKRWVQFGISPFGIYRPGIPEGIRAGIDQYDALYADALKWYHKGWLDYFTPQLYWAIDSPGQPYKKLLDWWASENKLGRHFWPGNYTSRIMKANGDWSPDEVINQVKITRANKGSTGNVHFSFKVFLDNEKGVNEALLNSVYKEQAIIPASPWLGGAAPAAPTVRAKAIEKRIDLTWSTAGRSGVRFWAVYGLKGQSWSLLRVLPSDQMELHVPRQGNSYRAFAVTGLSKTMVEGKPGTATL